VSQGGMPSLAGQSKADLVKKMQDFKSGRTPATIMPQLAKGYSDEQIDLIAGWFAAQKP
jgi:cytochrome c553